MEAIVDAGRIVSVLGSTPRDCALLALLEVDGAGVYSEVRWPITVRTGDEEFVFYEAQPGPQPRRTQSKRKRKEGKCQDR